jgi:hypothetical protein
MIVTFCIISYLVSHALIGRGCQCNLATVPNMAPEAGFELASYGSVAQGIAQDPIL